ncbi:MAG: hypothetical protein RLZ98_1136 [Pseudomonadota bacterium]|jgi:2,3-bisphosphoglycerate-independent phosphoglycerate mutase
MTSSHQRPGAPRPVVLCVLDGWGERADSANNAVALANTPNWDRMVATWPHAQLEACGEDVGLPAGQMGNSEVGHLNLGAGRIVWQDLPRVDNAIADGSLARNEALAAYIGKLKASGGTCHLLGLVSPGGVHAHQAHILALAGIVARAGVPVAIHAFLDGRDTPPKSAAGYMRDFLAGLEGLDNVRIEAVVGRYWAMDRDNRWERVERAYNLIVCAEAPEAADPISAIEASYAKDVADEFVDPVKMPGYGGMADGDGVLMANFRADRARQLLAALVVPGFQGFARQRVVKFAALLGMASYSTELDKYFPAILEPMILTETLGELVEKAHLRQLRIAETEKYPHVTYFFSGGREEAYEGEDRTLIPSPKVATYDLQPEMSAMEVTDKLVAAIKSKTYDLIVINYANGDMVGHTGILDAAKKAAETIDAAIGRVEAALIEVGGTMLLTADHGNCEMMVDPETGGPHTAHTMNQVPILLVNAREAGLGIGHGRLADVAPTLLQLMGLAQPEAMTGQSLLVRESATVPAK